MPEQDKEKDKSLVDVSWDGMLTTDAFRLADVGVSMVATLIRKNQDYGGSAWKTPYLMPNATAREGIQCRMSDKIQRLQTLLKGNGAAVSESVADTMMDLAGYCLLWLTVPEGKDDAV